MSTDWKPESLFLFIIFLIPGFIAEQVYVLFVSTDDTDLTKKLPRITGYSALHYGILGWIFFCIPDGTARYIYGYVVVFFISIFWTPVVLLVREPQKWRPILLKRWFWRIHRPSIKKSLQAMAKPEDSPWDRVLDGTPTFVRIRLKSGRFVGGYFGPGSAVSTAPNAHEIFIAKMYQFDETGSFRDAVPRTGIMVEGSEIETLEIIALEEIDREQGQS